MRIALPDLISNSYFPAVAAVELGCLKEEGFDGSVELIFPVDKCYQALARGDVDIVAGSAHSALAAFPNWEGVKLLAAQSRGMYWFLVMRADLNPIRGDLSIVKGKRIGAAPWVDMGLKQLLSAAGFDLIRDEIEIMPVPGAVGAGTNFGLTAARALADGRIDGFWANGMGTQVAVDSGAGTVVLDVRRGDGPAGCFGYTFASLAATDAFIAAHRPKVEAMVRALKRAQALLRADPDRATTVGKKVFPSEQARLIADIVRRDLPYFDPAITQEMVTGLAGFARSLGILERDLTFADVVAAGMAPLWAE